jgi:hypothetical protein
MPEMLPIGDIGGLSYYFRLDENGTNVSNGSYPDESQSNLHMKNAADWRL